jgi:hypothetical protein
MNLTSSIRAGAFAACLASFAATTAEAFALFGRDTGKAAFPFRIAIAHGTRGGSGQYDDHFKNAGWPSPPDKYPSTTNGMESLCAKLPDYDVVVVSTLFNYADGKGGSAIDLTPYAPAFRKWLEAGGAMFVMDAMYDQGRSWLEAVDPGLKLRSEGGCKNMLAPVQPVHPVLSFPNTRAGAGGWGHLLVPGGSEWQVVCGCCGGEAATIALATIGKGTVYVTSALEGGHWGVLDGLENFLAYLRTGGVLAVDSAQAALLPDFIPGKAVSYTLPPVSNRSDKAVEVAFDYTLKAGGKTRDYTARLTLPPFAAAAPELVCDIPMRGPAAATCTVSVDGKAIAPRSKSFELPPLFRVFGPKYRGYIPYDKRQPVSAGIEVVPYDGSFDGLACRLTIPADGTNLAAALTVAVSNRYARIPLDIKRNLLSTKRPATIRGELLKNGKTLAASEVTVSMPPGRGHTMSIADDLCLLKAGKPFFPLGMYHIGKPQDLREACADIAGLGMNMVQLFSWQGAASLDAAQANGLTAVMEMHPQFNAESIHAYMMGQHIDHPAMGIWYVADEPALKMTDPLAKYETYKTDIKHPAWLVSCNPSQYQLHGTACDILALDCYPIRSGQATRPLACISRLMGQGLAAVRDEKPIIFILQSFGREPEDMMANMAYQAVIHGASGLFWYAWAESKTSGAKYDPETRAILKRICGEMNTLMPMLTNREDRRLIVAGDVHALTGKGPGRGGKRYLLLANPSGHPAEATLDVPELGKAKKIVPLFGGETPPIQGATLPVALEPYGTRAFMW